jgi:NADH-quinone oxidoreductase subunit N
VQFQFPWAELSTEVALCALGVLLLGADLLTPEGRKRWVGWLGVGGLGLCLVPAVGTCSPPSAEPILGGTYLADGFQMFFRLFAVLAGLLVMLAALDSLEELPSHRGEFFALLVFAVLSLVLLAGAADLVLVYLFLEFVSITSYILAGYLKHRRESNEASLKYLLYGAIAAAVMLYGISLLYGATGTTHLPEVARRIGLAPAGLQLLAVALILVGFGFKISMVPFHQWTPDVYQGAPTPITAFLSVGPKAAGFAVLFRVFWTGLPAARLEVSWPDLLALLSVATMTVGNLLALVQHNLKRMLAYSSIAHAGYMLIGVVTIAASSQPNGEMAGVFGVLVYLMAYLFMNIGAFAVVIWFAHSTGSEEIDDYAGLAETAPLIAAAMTIFLLSLTGIPPTAGFLGKWWLFMAAIRSPDYWWLAVAGIVNSVISLFYYWNVVRLMYLRPVARPVSWRYPVALTAVIVLTVAVTLLLVLYPTPLLEWAQSTKQLLVPTWGRTL